nr:hypothetical protein [Tanacetum cinerariifolium]
MPLQKRARFTAPTGRFEFGESSSVAARQTRHTLAYRVDYGFINTMDASIYAFESKAMTAMGEDDRALLRAQVSLLTRERRYFRSMAYSYEREAADARQAWAYSKSRSQTIKAQIRALQRDVNVLQRQRIRDEDKLTSRIVLEMVLPLTGLGITSLIIKNDWIEEDAEEEEEDLEEDPKEDPKEEPKEDDDDMEMDDEAKVIDPC